MDLHIVGFRSINDKIYHFPSESIFLISGESGSGKSTIMNAIFWCLYGTLRNVRNFSSKTSKCMVEISFQNYSIIRSKSPEELKYKSNDIILSDDEAQEKIYQLFGSKDLWLSSCYLSQNSRNNFLNSSSEMRLKILSEISFLNEDPSVIINKIEKVLSEKLKEFTNLNDKLTTNFESYKKRRLAYNIKKSDYLNEKDLINIKYDIEYDIKNLELKLLELEKLKSTYETFVDRKQIIEKRLNEIELYDDFNEDDIQYINNKIEIIKKCKNLEKELELKENKELLSDNSLISSPLNIEIIKKINFRDDIQSKRSSICSSLNIDLSKDQIKKSLDKRNVLLKYQPILELIVKKQKIEDELEDIINKIDNINQKYNIIYSKHEIDEKLIYIENCKETLICPNCSTGLKHIGTKLILDKNYKNENLVEIKENIDISKQYLKFIEIKSELEVKNQELDEFLCKEQNLEEVIKYPLLNDNDKRKIEKEIFMIQDLLKTYEYELIEDNIDIDIIKKGDKKYKLEKIENEYKQLKEQCGDDSFDILLEKKKDIEIKIKTNNDNKSKKRVYEKDLNEINDKLKNIDDKQFEDIEKISLDIENRRNSKKISESKLEKWRIIEKFEEEKKEFEKTRDYLIELDKVIQNLSHLKHISCEIEHLTMTNIIESINCTINDLLLMIFEQPINVEFSIYKQNKSNSNIKPSITLKILYKGFELDSLNCLSGGEADRVSLAITLALSKFSSCPFILLDEFASGLDVNTKEMVIKSIKTMNDNKTIICISHDTVEGIYDYVEKI